jgi:hypothetical protein
MEGVWAFYTFSAVRWRSISAAGTRDVATSARWRAPVRPEEKTKTTTSLLVFIHHEGVRAGVGLCFELGQAAYWAGLLGCGWVAPWAARPGELLSIFFFLSFIHFLFSISYFEFIFEFHYAFRCLIILLS